MGETARRKGETLFSEEILREAAGIWESGTERWPGDDPREAAEAALLEALRARYNRERAEEDRWMSCICTSPFASDRSHSVFLEEKADRNALITALREAYENFDSRLAAAAELLLCRTEKPATMP